MAADGPSPDSGARLSYHSYEAPNGFVLWTAYGDFETPGTAERELDRRIKLAGKVLVNGWQLDEQESVMGRRAEVLVPTSKGLAFDLMWTWGRYFHEISSSLGCKETVLTVERRARVQLMKSGN